VDIFIGATEIKYLPAKFRHMKYLILCSEKLKAHLNAFGKTLSVPVFLALTIPGIF